MNKIMSILGLAVLVLTTIVSAESFVYWNNAPPEGGFSSSELGVSDPRGLVEWSVLHSYEWPKYEAGIRALNRKYQLSMLDCDWVQPATEYRSERVFKNAGYLKGNQCFLKTTKRVVKPVVEVVTPVVVDVNETEEPSEE